MSTHLTRRLIAGSASVLAATTLAMASPAAALTTRSQPTRTTASRTPQRPAATWKPSGGYGDPSNDEYCAHMTDVANDFVVEAQHKWVYGDIAGAKEAQANADAIAGQANMNGCNLTTLE